jgi:hypothetical protein
MVFEGISELGRRLWNFLLRAVRHETGAETWWETTREFYPEYDRDEAWGDYALVDINWRESEKMRYYRRDYRIGAERYMPAEMSGKSRYQTVVEYKLRDPVTHEYIRDPETGEIKVFAKRVKHDELKTREWLEEEAKKLQEIYEKGYEAVGLMPAHGYHDLNYPGESVW